MRRPLFAALCAAILLTGAWTTVTAPAPRQDAAALVADLMRKRDDAGPEIVNRLAELGTREAAEGLVKAYDEMGSILMQREVLRALATFDGVADSEQLALQKVADIATTAKQPELHNEAIDLLGESVSLGKYFLRLIVDSPAENPIRIRAMERHVDLATEEDLEWYEELFEGEEEKVRKAKKGEEPIKAVHSLLPIRELALTVLAPTMKDRELIEVAGEREKDQQEPSKAGIRRIALEELAKRGGKSGKKTAEDVFKDSRERPDNKVVAARLMFEIDPKKASARFLDEGQRDRSVMPTQLRYAMAEMLAERNDPGIGKKLVKMMGKGKPHIKIFVLKATRNLQEEKLRKPALEMLADESRAVRKETIEWFVARNETDVLPELKARITEEQDIDLLADLLDGISALAGDDPEWEQTLAGFVDHEKTEVRNAALILLARIDPQGNQQVFIDALAHSDWSTRFQAAKALEQVRSAEATGALIGRLSEESGFMLNRLSEILWRLTGQPHRKRVRAWQAWWSDNKDSFEPISAEKLAELEAEEEQRRLVERYDSPPSEFFGILIESHRVIFILDVSGSMAWETQGEFVGELGEPRIEVAKRELASAIQGLDPDALFNIVIFSNDVDRWLDGGISEANTTSKDEAIKFVERLGAGGGTNLYGALKDAFADKDVDTIVILSDGEPSVGAEQDPYRIRELVAEWNEHRGIVIHTIALGGSFRVLEWLAEDSGGDHARHD